MTDGYGTGLDWTDQSSPGPFSSSIAGVMMWEIEYSTERGPSTFDPPCFHLLIFTSNRLQSPAMSSGVFSLSPHFISQLILWETMQVSPAHLDSEPRLISLCFSFPAALCLSIVLNLRRHAWWRKKKNRENANQFIWMYIHEDCSLTGGWNWLSGLQHRAGGEER